MPFVDTKAVVVLLAVIRERERQRHRRRGIVPVSARTLAASVNGASSSSHVYPNESAFRGSVKFSVVGLDTETGCVCDATQPPPEAVALYSPFRSSRTSRSRPRPSWSSAGSASR